MHAGRQVRPLSALESSEWTYTPDAIAHRSAGFFRVVGIAYTEAGRPMTQLILDQPEVGVLGLAVAAGGSGTQCLVQLKCEPGTIGAVQLAPTCQATQSNLSRLHGGAPPPGSFLLAAGRRPVTASLQSEQGTRFWHKRNENVVWLVDEALEVPASDRTSLVWTSMAALRQALAVDYLVNTDLRSVLATSEWETLLGPEPFSRGHRDVLMNALAEAWGTQSPSEAIDRGEATLRWLATRRAEVEEATGDAVPVPLAAVRHTPQAPFVVRHFGVVIRGRERERWDQPLIASRGPGEVMLVGFRRCGVLRFLFHARWEPGLHDRVELHPSVCVAPGSPDSPSAATVRRLCKTGELRRLVWQSDEGGRFWRDRSVYRVVEVDDPGPFPDTFVALSPREIAWLAPRGVFTNEARSAISLLMSTPAVLPRQ